MFRCIKDAVDRTDLGQREYDSLVDPSAQNNNQPGPITYNFSGLFSPFSSRSRLLRLGVVLTGFRFRWLNGSGTDDDQHLLKRLFCRLELVDVDPVGMKCRIRVAGGIHDNSFSNEEWDDHYDLRIDYIVFALDDAAVDLYSLTHQIRVDKVTPFPRQESDLLQMNRAQDNVVTFLRGFEYQFQSADHSIEQFHASVEVQSGGAMAAIPSFQTCEIGLRDNTSDHPYGGLLHYLAMAFPDHDMPFIQHGIELGFDNQTGGEGSATSAGTILNAHVQPNQILFGLTSVDHVFNNTEHPLNLYHANVELSSSGPDGPNTQLVFALTAGLRDNSGKFDDPYNVHAEIAVIASPT